MFTLFVSIIWRGKEKMQNPNKSGSFPSPEGVLRVWTQSWLSDKACKA